MSDGAKSPFEPDQSAIPEENLPGRRRALKQMVTGVAVLASRVPAAQALDHLLGHHPTAVRRGAVTPEGKFRPTFFSPQEFQALETLCELILPATDTPGARAAGVHEYIDLIASEDPLLQGKYRHGLAWLDEESRRQFKVRFVQATAEQQNQMLRELSEGKGGPEAALGIELFRRAKADTVTGYYTSRIGLEKELEYKGNAYLPDYPGCAHEEH